MNWTHLLDFIVKNKIPVSTWNRDGEKRCAQLEQWLARPFDEGGGKVTVDIVYSIDSLPRRIFSPNLVKDILFDTSYEGGLTATIYLK